MRLKTVRLIQIWSTRIAQKIDFKKYGYNRFLKLALDAEKRGYVELKNNGLIWYIKKAS